MNVRRSITTLCVLLMFFSSSATRKDYQYSGNFAQEIGRTAVDPFLPITFSPDGINYFLKNIYNRPDYGTEILPNDFSHLLQFLQHGIDTRQAPSYAQSVLKLFSNKLKSATYVNAYVFVDMLKPLQKIMRHYFTCPKPRSPEQMKTTVNDALYSSFLSQFDFFKRDPKAFFNSLSHEILTSLNHELLGSQREIKKEQLRHTLVRFLELCAGKLIWSPEEPSEIWRSIKRTSSRLARFMKDDIVQDIDQLDDLLWSITHRFCFFVDLTGADLPVSFYQNIKQDLLRKTPLLCKLEEQERLITSKSDHLMQAVLAGEAKARAYTHGIVTH